MRPIAALSAVKQKPFFVFFLLLLASTPGIQYGSWPFQHPRKIRINNNIKPYVDQPRSEKAYNSSPTTVLILHFELSWSMLFNQGLKFNVIFSAMHIDDGFLQPDCVCLWSSRQPFRLFFHNHGHLAILGDVHVLIATTSCQSELAPVRGSYGKE
jgi:hypothetical protein